MGLAASQARLLSITSRMSDNELRSQLINNAKIRLTTDSARVSDEYVAALNNTKLMFSNFDLAGNEQYQGLTFNALTAYSGYNNQYGIVNSGGEIMVSSLDAGNFERAGGNVDRFLEQYGLEKTTTYFDTLRSNPDYLNNGMGYYDTFGEWQNIDTTLEELQIMYEGGVDANGITHYGLEGNYNSSEYVEYLSLVDNYNNSRSDYRGELQKAKREFAEAIIAENRSGFDAALGLWRNDEDPSGSTDYEDGRRGIVNPLLTRIYRRICRDELGLTYDDNPPTYSPVTIGTSPYIQGPDENDRFPFLDELNSYLRELTAMVSSSATSSFSYIASPEAIPGYVIFTRDSSNNITGYKICDEAHINDTSSAGYRGYVDAKIYDDGDITNSKYIHGYRDGSGDFTTGTIPTGINDYDTVLYLSISGTDRERLYYRPLADGEIEDTSNPNFYFTDSNGRRCVYTWESKNDPHFDSALEYTFDGTANGYTGYMLRNNTTRNSIGGDEIIRNLWNLVTNEVISYLRDDYFLNNSTDYPEVDAAYQNMQTAAHALAQFIWGGTTDYDSNPPYSGPGHAIVDDMFDTSSVNFEHRYYNNLDDQGWVLSATDDPSNRHYNPYNPIDTTHTLLGQNYQVVKDIFYVECMLEHYGVPNYTWIDVNNPEENGDAKARWYTNLFDRMCQGYKELGSGLASSEEWMQFAFESGLVHMEQVNKSSQWVSTMYSNCSGITESTVDVDITLAEAKYKREMAKIEAKDKKYDMELKNIDTEHESLKQEYESIKKVIQNNIKNNYNMYGNA